MQKQLAKFMDEFSNGGAIRHLADQNMSVSEIVKRLSFPMTQEKVAEIVWKHYINTGKIRLTYDPSVTTVEKVTYVEEYSRYGIPSMRRIVEQVPLENTEYVPCDFGKWLYQNKDILAKEKFLSNSQKDEGDYKQSSFIQKLQELSQKERAYVLELPWPLQRVYHQKDEWIMGILRKIGEAGIIWTDGQNDG